MSHGSLQNLIAANATKGAPTPEVGMGATILHWTDRTAATIIDVSPNGKTITVQEDTATRSDSHGMSDAQSYDYASNPDGATHVYTLRKNGKYVKQGNPLKGGQTVAIGYRRQYHDYSF
jgi:hypothetical protein